MNENKNIEELFKDKFENFEAEPKPDSWKKIAAVIGVSATAAAGGASSYLSLGKIIAAASIVGSATLGGYFLLKDNSSNVIADNNKPVVKDKPATKEVTVTIPEKSASYESEVKKTPEMASIKKEEPKVILPEIKNEEPKKETVSPEVISAEPKKETPAEIAKENPKKEEPAIVKEQPKTQPEKKEENPSAYTNLPNKKPELSPEKHNEELANANYRLATIIAGTLNGYAPLTVTFNNAGGATSNKWNFGDGTEISTDLAPTHVFEKAGDFKVMLYCEEGKRHEADTVTIHVKGSSLVVAPNAFSPNGDNTNDYFEIKGFDLVSLKVTISDPTTGREIYKWNTPEGRWDGRLPSGELAPAGSTFVYSYEAEGKDGVKHSKQGGIIKIQK